MLRNWAAKNTGNEAAQDIYMVETKEWLHSIVKSVYCYRNGSTQPLIPFLRNATQGPESKNII